MIIGSHVSFKNDGLLGSVKETLSYGANTFMFYTGAPQNTVRKAIDKNTTLKAWELMEENDVDINNVICHAPYIINLANKAKLDAWQFSINFLKAEIKRCEELGVKYIVLHPGSAVSHTKEEGINNIIEALNEVIDENTNVTILLETMAGKGTELGSNIDELKTIIDNIIYQNKIGVCLDTCHLNDSGIEISSFDKYLELFESTIGLKKVGCIHVNDSLNPIGSHKDRHANIGFGTIGFDNLINAIYNEKLKDVPKILETPYIEEYPPYKFEIESIIEKKFNPTLKEDVQNYYKNF
ncbi:MAG: deoxyribonuclease IV [Bacilli bacterium]|nr:deoxyribonuclease IV [Bacilli bacterium]